MGILFNQCKDIFLPFSCPIKVVFFSISSKMRAQIVAFIMKASMWYSGFFIPMAESSLHILHIR